VPHELALELDDFDVVVVDAGQAVRLPVLADVRERALHVADLGLHDLRVGTPPDAPRT